jgi:hypothetical protein
MHSKIGNYMVHYLCEPVRRMKMVRRVFDPVRTSPCGAQGQIRYCGRTGGWTQYVILVGHE